MAAKEIQIAPNNSGASFTKLPGSTGSLNREVSQLEDTIFGSNYGSTQPGLISWTVDANAFVKGFAGYSATIQEQGTSTSFSNLELEEESGSSGLIWRIKDADWDKSLWDKDATFSFTKGTGSGTAFTDSEITWVDYLFGRVKFASDPASGDEPIFADGKYFPLSQLGKAMTFTVTQTGDTTETTDFETAQGNNGFRTYSPTLLTVSIEMSQFYDSSEEFFTKLKDRDVFVIDVVPEGLAHSASVSLGTEAVARGYFTAVTENQEGDVGGDETESITFNLFVPDTPSDLNVPFRWELINSDMNQAIQDLLDAFTAQNEVQVKYLPDGTTGSGSGGKEGNAVVTEVTLTGGVDAMNEFSVSLQGTGELTDAT